MAVEVFKTISDPEFIAGIKEKSAYLFGKLNALKDKHGEKVTEIRGSGLIAGAVLKEIPAADAMNAIRENNDILVCVAGPDVVRFLPPLVIEKEHIDQAVDALDEFFDRLNESTERGTTGLRLTPCRNDECYSYRHACMS